MNNLERIRVVLCRPIYGGNIGSVCRAMANMGLSDLVLAGPGTFDPLEARKMACWATDILESCRRFSTLAEALADCALVFGATARTGLYRQHTRSPRDWAPGILAAAQNGKVALLFGPEDDGLSNEELAQCHHLILAQDARESFDLACVLFVPCERPPHKPAVSLVSGAHRAAMLAAALSGSTAFEICDLEIRRGGTTYSIDTVRTLAQRYLGDELVFIIGSDTLPELHLWKDVRELLRLCRFVTLARPGFDLKAMTAGNLNLEPELARILLDNVAIGHQVDISASDIRHRVAEGMRIRHLVPEAVDMYIAEHALYALG